MLDPEAWKIYYWIDRLASEIDQKARDSSTSDDSTWLYAKSVALREVCIGILNEDFSN